MAYSSDVPLNFGYNNEGTAGATTLSENSAAVGILTKTVDSFGFKFNLNTPFSLNMKFKCRNYFDNYD